MQVLVVSAFSLYTMITRFMKVGLNLDSFLCIRGTLVIMQGCIRDNEQG